mgnify:CR=1 FL=1
MQTAMAKAEEKMGKLDASVAQGFEERSGLQASMAAQEAAQEAATAAMSG